MGLGLSFELNPQPFFLEVSEHGGLLVGVCTNETTLFPKHPE